MALVVSCASVVFSLSLSFVVVLANHASPKLVFAALYSGSLGSWDNFGETLTKAIPLCLVGIGISLAFRARMWNIGGEGQLLLGAITCAAVGNLLKGHLPASAVIPIELVAGALSGSLWAGIAGVLKIRRGVPEVITTIMLNFIAAELISYLVHGPLQEHTHAQPATEPLPNTLMLPQLSNTSSLHGGIFIVIVLVVLTSVWLATTRNGFKLKVVGANDVAAHIYGYNVGSLRLGAMLFSGMFCGLAGAIELSGVLGQVYESYSPGYGFTGIATALIGRLNPFGILASSVFMGALYSGSGNMERDAHVSAGLVNVIQGLILLSLLVGQFIQFRNYSNRT